MVKSHWTPFCSIGSFTSFAKLEVQWAANGPAKRQLTGDFWWAVSGPLIIWNSYGPLMVLEFSDEFLVLFYKLQNRLFLIKSKFEVL